MCGVPPLHDSCAGSGADPPPPLAGGVGTPPGRRGGTPPPVVDLKSGGNRGSPPDVLREPLPACVQGRGGSHPSGHERGSSPSVFRVPELAQATPPPLAGGVGTPPGCTAESVQENIWLRRKGCARNLKGGGVPPTRSHARGEVPPLRNLFLGEGQPLTPSPK